MNDAEKDVYIKQLEARVQELENIIAIIPGHVYWLDKNNVYQGCNNQQFEFFGLKSKEEMIGKTTAELHNIQEEVDKINEVNLKVLQTGQAYDVIEEATYFGQKRYFQSLKKPIFDKKGDVQGIMGASIDITETKHLEQELSLAKQQLEHYNQQVALQLKDSEENIFQLDAIIAILPVHVYWFDKNNILRGCNDLQAETLGLKSRKDIVGKTNIDFFSSETAAEVTRVNQAILATGENYFVEEDVETPRGKFCYFSNKVALRNSQGEIVGGVGISLDITERKKMERDLKEAKKNAELANQVKMSFIRSMEHDIRTPFAGIMSIAHYLFGIEADGEKKELLGTIEEASKQLLNYLNDLLLFAYVDSSRLPNIIKAFEVRTLFSEVYMMELPAAKHKQLTFEYVLAKNVSSQITSDRFRLQRILINLVSNAIKFTEQGFVRFGAEIITELSDKKWLQIYIEDSGVGFKQKYIDFLHQEIDEKVTDIASLYEGTGLGLRVVKQFVHDMKGCITLCSTKEGSKYQIRVPL